MKLKPSYTKSSELLRDLAELQSYHANRRNRVLRKDIFICLKLKDLIRNSPPGVDLNCVYSASFYFSRLDPYDDISSVYWFSLRGMPPEIQKLYYCGDLEAFDLARRNLRILALLFAASIAESDGN